VVKSLPSQDWQQSINCQENHTSICPREPRIPKWISAKPGDSCRRRGSRHLKGIYLRFRLKSATAPSGGGIEVERRTIPMLLGLTVNSQRQDRGERGIPSSACSSCPCHSLISHGGWMFLANNTGLTLLAFARPQMESLSVADSPSRARARGGPEQTTLRNAFRMEISTKVSSTYPRSGLHSRT